MRSDIMILEKGLQEIKESGYLPVVSSLENSLVNDLVTRLTQVDYKDHLELVKIRGMIEGIRLLQRERDNILSNSEPINLGQPKPKAVK